MPSPGRSEQQAETFEFECPWCTAQLEISVDAPRKRRRGTYGVSPTPEIRCACGSCNKLIDLEIPSGSARSEGDARMEFEPPDAQALPGYERLGPEGGAWCRVRNCNLPNQPCKRYEGGIICVCRPHWDIIKGDEDYMRILRREARDRGRLCMPVSRAHAVLESRAHS